MEHYEVILLFILLVHFVLDFGLQTNEQALGKSTSNKMLFYHVGVYSGLWTLFSYALLRDFSDALTLGVITFVAHFITDWITSRWGKSFWSVGDTHNGFTVYGFDQMLHYFQLYMTFKYLGYI